MEQPLKLHFLKSARARLVVLVSIFALLAFVVVVKAYSEGWFESRDPLNFHQQPAILFFNRQKGGDCELVIYQAAAKQLQDWPKANRQGLQLIRIDLDRRPDLGEQFQIVRVPALLLVDPAGQIIYRQNETVSDVLPLDLPVIEEKIGELLRGN